MLHQPTHWLRLREETIQSSFNSPDKPFHYLASTLIRLNPLFRCDQNYPMYKGFSICSHVVATAHVNGDLRSFLDNLNGICVPNLIAIAKHGMPSGTGQKGGVAKRKPDQNIPAIETRSVRPCLQTSHPVTITTQSLTPAILSCIGARQNMCQTSVLTSCTFTSPSVPLLNTATTLTSYNAHAQDNSQLHVTNYSLSHQLKTYSTPTVTQCMSVPVSTSGRSDSQSSSLTCTTSYNPSVSQASASSLG